MIIVAIFVFAPEVHIPGWQSNVTFVYRFKLAFKNGYFFSVLAVALKMTTTRKRLPWSTRLTSKCFLADLSKSVRLCWWWSCHGYCNRCYTPLLISPVPQCLWCLGVLVLISASGTLSCMVLKTLTWYSPALTGTARWAAGHWVGFMLPVKCIHRFWLHCFGPWKNAQYNITNASVAFSSSRNQDDIPAGLLSQYALKHNFWIIAYLTFRTKPLLFSHALNPAAYKEMGLFLDTFLGLPQSEWVLRPPEGAL